MLDAESSRRQPIVITFLKNFFRRALNAPGWSMLRQRRALSGGPWLPSFVQWRQTIAALTLRERIVFGLGIALVFFAVAFAGGNAYLHRTAIVPAKGGAIDIGIVGRPLHINPVLSSSNPVDEDLVRLFFAGLYRYDGNGRLVSDLAESHAIGEQGKVIEVKLKENIFWPDGNPLIADDVAFTIEAIQDPAIRSPLFPVWNGIEVEVLDLRTIRFSLPAPYPPFLHNLTVGILPKHLWEEVSPENFALSDYNLKPTGLGPFRAVRFERTRDGRILSYALEPNPTSVRRPLIEQLGVRFFDQEADALGAFNQREIAFMSPISPAHRNESRSGAQIIETPLPRIFALFLNQTSSRALADKAVRQALAHATDRGPVLEALGGTMFVGAAERPIPEHVLGATQDTDVYDFSLDQARQLLEAQGWVRPAGVEESGVAAVARRKKDDSLSFTLTFREGADMQAIAEILKTQYHTIGVVLELRSLDPASYRKALADRDYHLLLAGIEFSLDPDPYAFWHSSQKFDPGGNVALYDNREVNAILEASRNDFVDESRGEKYAAFQKLLMQDAPAIFLWQSRYVAAISPQIHGFAPSILSSPSWRFGNVDEWYVQTKRVWK